MRQRVMIAIALAGDPDLLIADEPTTALDVTIQAGVLDLLHELGEARDLAVLLITHDLSIVAGFTHRVLVMYGGRLVERAPTRDLYADPRHPYTGLLLRSIPPLDRTEERLVAIAGSPPEPAARPDGCGFNPRCPFAVDPVCTTEHPAARHARRPGRRVPGHGLRPRRRDRPGIARACARAGCRHRRRRGRRRGAGQG